MALKLANEEQALELSVLFDDVVLDQYSSITKGSHSYYVCAREVGDYQYGFGRRVAFVYEEYGALPYQRYAALCIPQKGIICGISVEKFIKMRKGDLDRPFLYNDIIHWEIRL